MDSFEMVHKQYDAMIHKIIRSLNIYKDKDAFYQTGLIALWEAYDKFNPEIGAFPAYAYSYIKGRIMTELTCNHLNEERSVYQKEEFWELIEDEYPIEALPKERILSYCSELTVNQTKWVLYTCLEMLSVREIAKVEKVSISAVKKWRKGAIEKLKSLEL